MDYEVSERALEYLRAHRDRIGGLDPDTELEPGEDFEQPDGSRRAYFFQLYRGVRSHGPSVLCIVFPDGRVEVDEFERPAIDVDVTPRIPPAQALAIATEHYGQTPDRFDGVLRLMPGEPYVLVWMLELGVENHYRIDAQTGEILGTSVC